MESEQMNRAFVRSHCQEPRRSKIDDSLEVPAAQAKELHLQGEFSRAA